ncbi:MAG: type II toxin-antitoxin system VapC family toxin [Verrucomicrobiae bacterium]|nr:type II toxin-antitoxin system VapC family toxin [Verrucomicrobiae bacterium]
MNLLLDTCAILWLVNSADRFSRVARQAIDEAWVVYVSPVSAWEIGLKAGKECLTLPEALGTWWPRMIETHQVTEMPLYGAAAVRSTLLPPIHQDPADRLLIAIALEHQCTLLTPDPTIRSYPNLRTLW